MGRALTSREQCADFVRGCAFLGTGGGGSRERGLRLLEEALEDGVPLAWVDVGDIPDDAWTCTAFGMGSVAPETDETRAAIAAMGLTEREADRAMERAVRELEAYARVRIGALVAAELGGGNSAGPLVAAMRLGIALVDGDYAGRAIPDEMQGTPYLFGKESHPLASVSPWGDVVILKEAQNPFMLERVGKHLAIAAFGHCQQAATLLLGREMKEIVVRGTLTRALELGRAIREARAAGADPVDAAARQTHGWRVFDGRVTRKEWEDRDGYMFGTTTIEGTGRFAGRTLDVWFKNENHVSWLDSRPWICSPDLLVLADPPTGEGWSNTALDRGDDVAAVAIRGLEAFRSDRGLACAGPRYFGFDVDYVAVEELVELPSL